MDPEELEAFDDYCARNGIGADEPPDAFAQWFADRTGAAVIGGPADEAPTFRCRRIRLLSVEAPASLAVALRYNMTRRPERGRRASFPPPLAPSRRGAPFSAWT